MKNDTMLTENNLKVKFFIILFLDFWIFKNLNIIKQAAFKLFDKDGDGEINSEEVMTVLCS